MRKCLFDIVRQILEDLIVRLDPFDLLGIPMIVSLRLDTAYMFSLFLVRFGNSVTVVLCGSQ